MSYTFIYSSIFIFLLFSAICCPPCASAVRFLILQTPAMMTDVEILQNFHEIRRKVLANENPTCLSLNDADTTGIPSSKYEHGHCCETFEI